MSKLDLTTNTILLDTKGLYCPEPVMMLHNAVRDVDDKMQIKVVATDPSTQRDIPKFCQFLGHSLKSQSHVADEFIYLIEVNK
ncbi:sulfurtransferase TusA [Marinicellulosiphila megalodicopiae]|uniref:sulfurtransferase TusA n=1 Tax=Marinicellulosiphila megalodicopiae TaxID=2724896 RepID=UPI003BAEA650